MLQTVERFVEGFVLLGEVQTNQVIDVLAEEARAGNSTYTYIAGEYVTEFEVALVTEFRDIQQDVICALRYGVDDTDIVESFQEQISLFGVFILKLFVVIIAEVQSDNRSLLQRSCRADGQEIMNLFRNIDNMRRRDDIA